MSYTEGLSGLKRQISKGSVNTPRVTNKGKVGRVYAVIMNENTPSAEIFKKYGGWDALGTIFYLDYSKREDFTTPQIIEKIKENYFQVARPSDFNNKSFPLIGELVSIQDLPSPLTPLSNDLKIKYYSKSINYWNNSHHNADSVLSDGNLGKNFTQRQDVRPLMPFEGDQIIEGRNGNSLRFGSTSKYSNNWWNTGEKDGDPIIVFSNGHQYDSGSLSPYVEDLGKDSSMICLTSTQTVPLILGKTNLNPLTKPISLENYRDPQIILLSDRIVLASRKDEVMITATSNIEIYTKNVINMDADDRIVHNSPYIFLGLNKNELPTEPALLGIKSVTLLADMLESLGEFASSLSGAVSTPEGAPIIDITTAATMLYEKIDGMMENLEGLLSKKVYISE